MSFKRVLSVGQCLADHSALTDSLRRHFEAETVSVNSGADALSKLKEEDFDLVMVNRIFDNDGSSGVNWIRLMKAEEGLADIPVMLVSNYEDAQGEALQAGAVRGFGKAAMEQPPT